MKKIFAQMNEIIESEGGDLIKGAIFTDRYNGRKSVGMMVESDGDSKSGKKEYSDIIYIDFACIQNKTLEKKLECLMNYGNLISLNDAKATATYIDANSEHMNQISITLKASFREMCEALLDLKRYSGESDEQGYRVRTLQDDDGKLYIFIRTSVFDEEARKYDWVPVHLKRALKLSDMLFTNSGRYDYKTEWNELRGICIRIDDLKKEVE